MAIKSLSNAKFVARGYGQVEPNLLSAQRNGQIYAQLPAKGDIDMLENGQFVKYNYKDGVVDFAGKGEWMLVFNEIKLYRDREQAEDFAMIKSNYIASVYSPIGQNSSALNTVLDYAGQVKVEGASAADAKIQIPAYQYGVPMPAGATMTPRVFKTMIGDIYTTNCVNEEALVVGDELVVGADGYLKKAASEDADGMVWQVVKVYTLADNQPAVKLMRIA